MTNEREPNPFTPFYDEAERNRFFAQIQLLDITRIVVDYSGSGDSGAIDSVTAMNKDNSAVSVDNPTFQGKQIRDWHDVKKGWQKTIEDHTYTMEEYITHITEVALEATGLDWYNNEGGQGSFNIKVTSDGFELKLAVGINEIHVDTSTFTFGTDGMQQDDEPEGD